MDLFIAPFSQELEPPQIPGRFSDRVTLDNENSSGNEGVALVQLADGTTLSAAQLMQMSQEINGTPSGAETVRGTSGADLIDGRGGHDFVAGYGGNDTFVFNPGYGNLEIYEVQAEGDQPVLQLGAGITASELHATTDLNNLFLTDGVTGDEIELSDMWSTPTEGITSLRLADGTTLTRSQVLQLEMTGTTGNDTIYGTTGDDLFDGKGGGDLANGYGGNDTFVFDAGYGHLVIDNSYTGAQQPVLQMGEGIASSALHVTASGSDLILTDGISGDQITLTNQASSSESGVAVVGFSDGTTLTAAQLIQLWHQVIGTPGNDTLTGTSGAELIDGEGGTDSITGNGGNDTIVFDPGYGSLTINEHYTSSQQPVLQLGDGITAASLSATKSGNDLVLADGVSGDQITLYDMWSSTTYGVATAQFADGTTLTRNQLIQLEMTGTTGADTIAGTSGGELIDGKGGTDSITGGGGNDTIVFESGYGNLTLNEHYTSGQQPVLQLGSGITATSLSATKSGNNLVLADGVSGDQITLYDMWSSSTYGVETAQLADGTTLTRTQLIQLEMIGTTGNDTLTGTTGDDPFDGKGGTDSITGSGGNDTFVFDPGYGKLTINEAFTSGQQPVLQLGTGITASALRVAKSGNNLVLTDGVSGDAVTLLSMWSSDTHGVSTAQLSDGTTLSREQLMQMEMTGTTGNDTLYGTAGDDLIDGGGGTDSAVGSGGNDTFVFDQGYGKLTINEAYTSGQQPVLELGSGITAASLKATKSSNNLVLADGVSGDQIILTNMWSSTTAGVETAQLADGSTLTRSQLIQMEMAGTTGNDTFYGTAGDELLDGEGGTDSIIGGGGNDTFVFDPGYGKLTINEAYTSGQQPVLQLGSGITAASLTVATSGNNLVLTDGVTGDKITLVSMATSATNGVESVDLADGTVITRSQLTQTQQDAGASSASAGVAPASLQDASSRTGTSVPAGLAPTTQADDTSTSTTSSVPNAVPGGSLTSSTQNVDAGADAAPYAGAQPDLPSAQASAPDLASNTPSGLQAAAPATDVQPPAASNDASQQGSAQLSPSSFSVGLQSAVAQAQVQPEQEADPTPGAPADPLMSDPDDIAAQPGSASTGGMDSPAAPTPLASATWKNALPSGQQLRAFNAAHAADDMIKALTAQGSMRTPDQGPDLGRQPAGQIQLQGGATWSLTALDRTMAALAPVSGSADGSADRAHALLASAMTSFAPMASAESSPLVPPLATDAYALAAAA